MPNHNKKRNVGLLYEFLVRTMSDAVVENDAHRRDTALSIIKKHFKKDTEIYKEFRLFHSLAATTVESDSVADSILESAKEVSRKYDAQKLDRQKSLLIKDINHNIKDANFYHRRFNEYTTYATIQTLLNEWRKPIPSDIVRVAEYEDNLKKWLLSEKQSSPIEDEEHTDPLVEKLMLKKFNERYGDSLTNGQADIIRSYIFSQEKIEDKLKEVKDQAVQNISKFLANPKNKGDTYLFEKLQKAKVIIESTVISEVNDQKVERFLDIAKLMHEINSE